MKHDCDYFKHENWKVTRNRGAQDTGAWSEHRNKFVKTWKYICGKVWKMNFQAQSIQNEDFYEKEDLSNLTDINIAYKIICHTSMGSLVLFY